MQLFQTLAGRSFMALVTISLIGCGGSGPKATQTADGGAEVEEPPSPRELYTHYIGEAGMAEAEQRTEDAIEYYLLAADAMEQSGETTLEQGDAHAQAARLAYVKYQKELAIEQYDKAIQIYLRFSGNSLAKASDAFTNMGVIWKELHNTAKARTCWQQALELYNKTPAEFQSPANAEKIQQNLRDLNEGF